MNKSARPICIDLDQLIMHNKDHHWHISIIKMPLDTHTQTSSSHIIHIKIMKVIPNIQSNSAHAKIFLTFSAQRHAI